MAKRIDPLTNLADFLVQDLMAMSDEEILAECSPEEIEEAKRLMAKCLASTDEQSMTEK